MRTEYFDYYQDESGTVAPNLLELKMERLMM